MKLEYNITEQDFVRGLKFALKKHPSRLNRVSLNTSTGMGAAFLVLWLYNMSVPGRAILADFNFFILFLGIVLIILPFWILRNQKKLYAASPALRDRITLEITEAGLRASGPSHDGISDWRNFTSFGEDQHSLVIFMTTQVFILVPKRELAPDMVAELRSELAKFLKPAA